MNSQVIVRNLLINYMVTDEGRKANGCLLFLHGWRSEAKVWLPIISNLKNIGAAIYAIDLPGFGGSQVPSAAMTVGDYAEVVKDFIEKLGLKNVVIIGHSFGGRVGIKLAAQKPEIVSKLILVDSAGFAMGHNKKSLMSAAAKIAKPFFKPKFMQGFRKKIYQNIGAEDYVATPELQKTFVNIVSEDLTEDMKKINCLTLIINGENDADTPVEFGKKMNGLILGSEFVIIKDAGHFSFLDQPEEFILKLSNFIQP